MRAAGEPIAYNTVAQKAKVSRQYLYENFKDTIDQLRSRTRRQTVMLDGEEVVVRSAGRAATIELALRNKVARLEADLKEVRKEAGLLRNRVEKALGEAEEWRQRHKQAVSELLELRSRAQR